MDGQLVLEKLRVLLAGKDPVVKTQEVKALIDYALNLERLLAEALSFQHGNKRQAS